MFHTSIYGPLDRLQEHAQEPPGYLQWPFD